jgi:hypothetical protein
MAAIKAIKAGVLAKEPFYASEKAPIFLIKNL